MPRIRYPNLSTKYQQAWASYQKDWAHIDLALNQVISSCAAPTWKNVHTKVVFVDGVYRAQLTRTLGQGADHHVATALHSAKGSIGPVIRRLTGQSSLTLARIANVVSAHAAVLQSLRATTGANRKAVRSFASKYLHFHADIVPIYDSLASGHIGRFGSWPGYQGTVRRARQGLVLPAGADTVYVEYVLRFFVISEHLKSLQVSLPVTTKGVDHMLWLG